MYDVTIIGAGPAGISASLYAKRANLNVLVLYFGESNLEKSSKIEELEEKIKGNEEVISDLRSEVKNCNN